MRAAATIPTLEGVSRKAFREGTHRLIAPEQTLARVLALAPAMGITRVADVTGLDSIGVPVVMVCRPNARSLAVTQGKGLTLAAAKASGLMESVEAYHAEHITKPLKVASYEELRYTHRVANVGRLPRVLGSSFHAYLPLPWIEGYDLLSGEPAWVPYEMVHTNYTLSLRLGPSCFPATSNGLASGNHLMEAVSHGICEVVERDAATLWHLLDDVPRTGTRLDLRSVDDPHCQGVLGKLERAGVSAAVWETTSDVGISAFKCVIRERTDDPLRRLYAAEGMGCHPVRHIGLLRALTEAIQSRLTAIAGSRDDLLPGEYSRTRSAQVLGMNHAFADAAHEGRLFPDGPSWDGNTFEEDVAWELDRLQSSGIEEVIVVDLTKPEFALPVARVLIPGLEGAFGAAGYVPGERARARLNGPP